MSENLRTDVILVDKTDLLQTIKANREKHIQTYSEAIKGYQEEMIKALYKRIKRVKEDPEGDVGIAIYKPTSMAKEYDQYIKALEMDQREILELNRQEFNQLVMDNWQWSDQFNRTTTMYLNKMK